MSGFGMFGNMGGGYSANQPFGAGFQQPQPVPQVQPQLRTNKVFVTSLEDALNRYAEPNTIMVYRHQDEKFEYEIMTDMQGKKSYKTLVLTDYSTVEQRSEDRGTVITQEALSAIESKLEVLEGKVESLESALARRKSEKNGGNE